MTYDLTPVYRTDAKLGAAYEQSLAWAKERRTVDELLQFKSGESIKEAFGWIPDCERMMIRHERSLLVARKSVAVAKGLKKGKYNSVGNPSAKYESEALKRLASLQVVLTLFGAVPEEEIKQISYLYEEFQNARRLKTQEENHLRRIRFLGGDIGLLMDI